MSSVRITIPVSYRARPYQVAAWRAFESGCRRLVMVWHRRAGKDLTAVNMLVTRAVQDPGNYYYYYPTSILGRKSLWDGKDKSGVPFLDCFPKDLVLNRNSTEMKLRLRCAGGMESLFQVVGADKLDVVGPNPRGVVFSEYSKMNPRAWEYTCPILSENGGWSIFTYTSRGRNHGYKLFCLGEKNSNWFSELLTVDDTHAISLDAIEEDRAMGMSEELLKQEYYCSWNCGMEGSIYSSLLETVRISGRYCDVPVDDSVRVFTFWDLGIGDSTSIWFVQFVGGEIHLIDFYQSHGKGIKHYIEILETKGYLYGGHYGPHDAESRSLQTGVTLRETAKRLGLSFEVVPRTDISPGLESVRSILGRCWFDRSNCHFGFSCLEQYHYCYNPLRRVHSSVPEHDWSSHCADAFRMLGVSVRMGLIHEYLPLKSGPSTVIPVTSYKVLGKESGYSVLTY